MDRETIVWALVFSLPVGVGITGFAARVVNEGVLHPLAVAAGVGTTVAVFSLVVFAVSGGSVEAVQEGPG